MTEDHENGEPPVFRSFALEAGEDENVLCIDCETNEDENADCSTICVETDTDGVTNIKDHFTISVPSSVVRFRSKTPTTFRIYSETHTQLILESRQDARGRHHVNMKRLRDGTSTLTLLRLTYTIVVFFFSGFVLVFCLQIMLILMTEFTIASGFTAAQNLQGFHSVGMLLSFPVFIYGMATALVISGRKSYLIPNKSSLLRAVLRPHMIFFVCLTDFLLDTWNGHTLFKTFLFGRYSGVVTEWVAFFAFLGVPLFVMCIGLFTKSDRWWEWTGLTWFCSVLIFYIVFAIVCVYYETNGCIDLIRNHYCEDNASFLHVMKLALILRQMNVYSGYTRISYLTAGALTDAMDLDVQNPTDASRKRTSLYSAFVQMKCFQKIGMFLKLETPQKMYSVDEVQDYHVFWTRHSWSLEKIFCQTTESRFVAIIRGPDALNKAQLRSGIVCSFLGNVLILLTFSALIVWLDLGRIPQLAYWAIAILLVLIPQFSRTWRLYNMTKDIFGEMAGLSQFEKISKGAMSHVNSAAHVATTAIDNGAEEMGNVLSKAANALNLTVHHDLDESPDLPDAALEVTMDRGESQAEGPDTAKGDRPDNENEAVFTVFGSWRTVKLTERWCWIILVIEFFVFFLWPSITLLALGNLAVDLIFDCVAIFTLMRRALNPVVMIKEIGSLDGIHSKGLHEKRERQAIMNNIVSNISTARAQGRWIGALSLLLACCLFVAFATIASGTTNTDFSSSNKQFTYVDDFEYFPIPELPYQTCNYGKQIFQDIPVTKLVDLVFSALMSYRANNATQNQLNSWFGDNVVLNRADIVTEYRNLTGSYNFPVVYRLYEFTSLNSAIVSIQGTSNTWDLFADAQLWSAAWLLQGLRAAMPFGQMWTPIIDDLILGLSWLNSPTLNRLAYYKETTSFVNYLKDAHLYTNLAITGHSLGGGLAIISAAQTGVPGLGVSGPNALLSRQSFMPKLTQEQLNTLTFNIIPDRDIIAHIDDIARLSQRVRCNADVNDLLDCHSVERTWCEVMYTCGSNGRPYICECTTEYGYPVPIATGNRTFEEACSG